MTGAASARPRIRFAMADPPVVKETTMMPVAARRPGLAAAAMKRTGEKEKTAVPSCCGSVAMPLTSQFVNMSWSSPAAKAMFDAEEELFFGGRWPASTF